MEFPESERDFRRVIWERFQATSTLTPEEILGCADLADECYGRMGNIKLKTKDESRIRQAGILRKLRQVALEAARLAVIAKGGYVEFAGRMMVINGADQLVSYDPAKLYLKNNQSLLIDVYEARESLRLRPLYLRRSERARRLATSRAGSALKKGA